LELKIGTEEGTRNKPFNDYKRQIVKGKPGDRPRKKWRLKANKISGAGEGGDGRGRYEGNFVSKGKTGAKKVHGGINKTAAGIERR